MSRPLTCAKRNFSLQDMWDNLCNHRSDTVELFEFDPKTRLRGAQWAEFSMKPSGHGAYKVTCTRSVSGTFNFTFSVNGASLETTEHVYALHVSQAGDPAPPPSSIALPPHPPYPTNAFDNTLLPSPLCTSPQFFMIFTSSRSP